MENNVTSQNINQIKEMIKEYFLNKLGGISLKERLDAALVQRGLCQSRERAKIVIMEGLVYVNGQKSDKAGTQVKDDDEIEVRGETLKYVSRGGKKLEKAFETSIGQEIYDRLEQEIMADE